MPNFAIKHRAEYLEPSFGAKAMKNEYWKKNLRYLAWLLSVWLIVSLGCSVLFVDALDQIQIGGFKLGFWFAQQGAIYVFVILIFVYVLLMNRLDKQVEADAQ